MNLTCAKQTPFEFPPSLIADLPFAGSAQRRLFACRTNARSKLRFAAASFPAEEVGGDYYDFLDLGAGCFGLVLADVCGKGMAASRLTAKLQASMRRECARGCDAYAAMCERVNARFYESTLPEQYATMFFAHFDERTHRVKYVNCGHPPALLVSRRGSVRRLAATGVPLGMFDRWDGKYAAIDMEPGDSLFVYSDGVTEAGIETGDEFGESRLISFLQASRSADVETTVGGLIRAVRAYEFGPQVDDVTVAGMQCV